MNIILGEDKAKDLEEKYIVLSLDTFTVKGHAAQVRSFCVIENLPIAELSQAASYRDLHENLMINYGRRNWVFCEQAIEHLMGRWNGEVDSFYHDLSMRIKRWQKDDPGPEWQPAIIRES